MTTVRLTVRLEDDAITILPFVNDTITQPSSLTAANTLTISNVATTTAQSLLAEGHSSGHNTDWYRTRSVELFLAQVQQADEALRSAIHTTAGDVAIQDDRTMSQVPESPQHIDSPGGSADSD